MCGILAGTQSAAAPFRELPPCSSARASSQVLIPQWERSPSPITMPIPFPASPSSPRFHLCSPPTSMTRSSLCHTDPRPLATAWGQSHPFPASQPGQHRRLAAGLGVPGQELGLGTSNKTQSSSSRRMEAFSPPGTQASWEEATEITQVSRSRTVAVSVPALSLTHTQGRQPVDLLAKCKNQWQDGKRPLNCGC